MLHRKKNQSCSQSPPSYQSPTPLQIFCTTKAIPFLLKKVASKVLIYFETRKRKPSFVLHVQQTIQHVAITCDLADRYFLSYTLLVLSQVHNPYECIAVGKRGQQGDRPGTLIGGAETSFAPPPT